MLEHKSLKAIANELGVSPSYLSQVIHGKRPPSVRVAEALSSVKQIKQYHMPNQVREVKQTKPQKGLISPWSLVQVQSLPP